MHCDVVHDHKNERLIEFKTAHSYLQVLKHLEDLSEVEDYLRFVGRLHDVAGVDPRFLDVTGLAFCHALDQVIAAARRIFSILCYYCIFSPIYFHQVTQLVNLKNI